MPSQHGAGRARVAFGTLFSLVGVTLLGLAVGGDLLGGEPGFGEHQAIAAALGLVIAGTGVLLIAGRGRRLSVPWLAPLALLSGSLVVAAALAEVTLRVFYAVKPPPIMLDDRLGWRAMPGWRRTGWARDAGGRLTRLSCTTDAQGRRLAHDAALDAPRLLVVGDSLTHAIDVSDTDTYFARLQAATGWSVHAYGCLGHGLLQESMVLEELVATARPDLILWQWTANDVVNGSERLERASRLSNNGLRRPFLNASGELYFALPKPWPRLRHAINGHFRLGAVVLPRYDRLAAARGDSIETRVFAGATLPAYSDAIAACGRVVADVRRRWPEIAVAAFCAHCPEPIQTDLAAVAQANGVILLTGVTEAIEQAEGRGVVVRAGDRAHWNATGHALCAQALEAGLVAAMAARTRQMPPA